MRIEFVGTPRVASGDAIALEVEAQVDGAPLTCVVTEEALAAVAPDVPARTDAPKLFHENESLFRDVLLDKLGMAGRQRPDRVLILAADVTNRRF